MEIFLSLTLAWTWVLGAYTLGLVHFDEVNPRKWNQTRVDWALHLLWPLLPFYVVALIAKMAWNDYREKRSKREAPRRWRVPTSHG